MVPEPPSNDRTAYNAKTRAVPREMESYLSYRQRMEDFITARNRRVQEYARIHL